VNRPSAFARPRPTTPLPILSETDLLQAQNRLALAAKTREDLSDAKKRHRIRILTPILVPGHNDLIPKQLDVNLPLQRELKWVEKLELMTLLFLHGMALGSWFVPIGSVLESANLRSVIPFAFATSAVAALLSPLFFGAMADRSVPPIQVLRWLSLGTACFVGTVAWGIQSRWNPWLILLLIQLQSLLSVPTNSLTGSIVFARIGNSHRQFGAIRAMGTAGWIAGCWLISAMHVDSSPRAFQISALLWIALAAYTLFIPKEATISTSRNKLTLRERFGLDAWSLLKIHDHRVIFTTAALVAIPFAAFYPYTPALMSDLGLQRTSAWMSLGQIIEVGVLFAIGGILARWQLKWVVLTGLFCGVLRYALYATNSPIPVLIGVSLHGMAYALTYISAQIYLAKKIDPAWRTRAQALLSMMTGGVGNLVGYLCTGSWLAYCEHDGQENWRLFWSGLCFLVICVGIYFAQSYKGRGTLR